jgi:hypothetical protein
MLEDLLLAQMPIELQRASHLDHFGRQRAFSGLHEASNLHRNRRCTRYDAGVRRQLIERPENGQGIDADVFVESFVFPCQQHFNVALIDFGGL